MFVNYSYMRSAISAMTSDLASALVWIAAIVVVIFAFSRLTAGERPRGEDEPRRRSLGIGPGTSGTVYDWLNQEKRNAIEMIVEDKAAARDPEDKDGNLPELEEPGDGEPETRRGREKVH
jgi:hypothetical protein